MAAGGAVCRHRSSATAGVSFAIWLSIPEAKRAQAIDAVTRSSVDERRAPTANDERLRPAPYVVEGALSVAEMKRLVAELRTTVGVVEIEFLPDVAPNHVRNFIELARNRFYDGTRFHRVHPLFMIQDGDPNTKSEDRESWGRGGSRNKIAAEFSNLSHERGIVSMARAADPDSATSQFFIMVERKPELNATVLR